MALLNEGLQVLLLGISVVFLFLGVLVAFVSFISHLARIIDGPPDTRHTKVAESALTEHASDANLIPVIAAAIHRYRLSRIRER